MEHHLVNLLALATDMAADLGMGRDYRYARMFVQLEALRDTAAKLATEMEQAELVNCPEDFNDSPF